MSQLRIKSNKYPEFIQNKISHSYYSSSDTFTLSTPAILATLPFPNPLRTLLLKDPAFSQTFTLSLFKSLLRCHLRDAGHTDILCTPVPLF